MSADAACMKVSLRLNADEGDLLCTEKSIYLAFISNFYEVTAFVPILKVVFYPHFLVPVK